MSLAWFALGWGMFCGLILLFVSVLGYRSPESSRVVAWLDRAYRRGPNGSDRGPSFSRERFLQNIWICGFVLLLGVVVIVRELSR